MKKKNTSSRFKIVCSVILSLAIAVAFWFMVKYSQYENAEALVSVLSRGIV